LATLAQTMSKTDNATPPIQTTTLVSGPAIGPRANCNGAATAVGRAVSGAPSAIQLWRRAFVRSAFAASALTPGASRTSISTQLQLYLL
jgi:hypothetical protein